VAYVEAVSRPAGVEWSAVLNFGFFGLEMACLLERFAEADRPIFSLKQTTEY